MSKLAGTSAAAAVTIRFEGYSVVPFSRAAWQQQRNPGWSSTAPMAQTVHNGEDATQSFASGGTFGMLTGFILSSPPAFTLTFGPAPGAS
jgi:hypothetical protein